MDVLNILFTGDVGCGKTSLIHAVIREYYGDHDYSSNILSINNLKEQGITYYRNDVKTFCQTASSILGKKKIIILDDIDIINEQSQQVFRNCIDKYSHNVGFIASCSNTQRVIDSLQSRMSIIKIKTFSNDSLGKIMKNICNIENISISSQAHQFILSISNNSIRILINYLEKLKLLNLRISPLESRTRFAQIYHFTNSLSLLSHASRRKTQEAIADNCSNYSIMVIR